MMHDLVAIKNRAIARGFSELAGAHVAVGYERMGDALFAYGKEHGGYNIAVDPEMFEASSLAMEGGIAQQLAHIARDAKRGPFCDAMDSLLYNRLGIYRTMDDRTADMLAARRGFANQLLALHEFHDASYEPYDKSDGLTVVELRAFIGSRT